MSLAATLAGGVLSLCAATAAVAAPLEDLRRLVEANQFEQAWQLGQRSPELLGNAHFDFLYGVAAINAGHVPEGLLALERHLAVVPANDRARLELARGYFLVGEYPRARSEFEFVLRYNPPANVRRNIEGFLQAMNLRDAADRHASARFYAELGAGRDSNVNSGTFQTELQLSTGPQPIAPDSPSRGVADNFVQLALGGQQSLRVSNQVSVSAGADLDVRQNEFQRDFDQTSVALNAGVTQLHGAGLYRLTLSLGELRIAGARYRDTLALAGEGQWTLSPTLSLLGQWQFGEMRHAESDAVRDGRTVGLAGMLTQQFPDLPGAPAFGARLSWTQDSNQRLRPDLSRDVPLLRLFGAVSPSQRWRLSVGFTAYRQDFGGTDTAFNSIRADTTVALDATAQWTIDNQWSLRAEASWQRNRSNQSLYDSRRAMGALKLRYQF